jgi:hypothetical protein
MQAVGAFGLGLVPVSPYLAIPRLGFFNLDRLLFLILILFVAFNLNKVVIKGAARLSIVLAYALSVLVLISFLVNEKSYITIFIAYNFFLTYFVFSLLIFCYQRDGSNYEFGRELFYSIIIIWSIAAIVFSGWALYNQLVLGQIIYPSFLELPESSEVRYRTMMSGFRLFLPFPTAPHLGFMCLGVVLILIIDLYKKTPISIKLKVFLISILLIIALVTQSRSPLYAFLLSIVVLFSGNVIFSSRNKKSRSILIVASMAFLVPVSLLSFYYLDFGLGRLDLDIAKIMESRHLSIRLDAIQIIMTSDVKSLIFGQGVGTLLNYGIAPYTFTSYLTVLYEVGIFGAIFYCLIIFSPILALLLRPKKRARLYCYSLSEVSSIFVFIFVSNLFYEFKLLPVSAILTAYLIYMAQLKIGTSDHE